MINVTDEIKQAYDVSTTQIDKIILEEQEYRITNVEYYDDCYDEGNVFGTAIAKCLEFEIENSIDLEKKEIEYLTGIVIDGETKWISLGKFIIQDVEPNDTTNINKVTAMDYMLKTNTEYHTSLNYDSNRITLLQVLQEVCTNSEIGLATIDFVNADFIVDSNQFEEGTLNRQVIQAIAQISGTVAKIKNDNKLYLINPNQETEIRKVFTLNNYEEAEIKRATHPINLVSLAMADVEGENITLRDEESITDNGENSLVINDNPFAYRQDKREQLITALFDAVKGFEYKSFSFTCQGISYLETVDKIQFKDKEGNIYNSYLFRFNYKSPNGLESTIEAPSMTKATVNYQNIPNMLDRVKRTEIIVNKQENEVKMIAQQQEIIQKELDYTVSKVDVLYALGDDETEAPSEGWSIIAPQWQSGKYMWQKTVTTYSNGTITESAATCISGANGKDGEDGQAGSDGKSAYQIWLDTGNTGTEEDYLNSLKGKGEKGDPGIGVKSILPQYYLSSSNETQSDGEWKETQDTWEEGKYLWTRSQITWTDDNITYTTPVLAEAINSANEKAQQLEQVINEQKAEQTITNNSIINMVSETTTRLNNDYLTAEQVEAENQTLKEDIELIKQQQTTVTTTAQGLQVQIDEINNEGVKTVKNTTVNIDDNGVTVGKSDSEFSTTMNNTGTYMYAYGKEIAKYDKDGVETANFKATGEVEIGYLKIIKGTMNNEKRTHIHWIGG